MIVRTARYAFHAFLQLLAVTSLLLLPGSRALAQVAGATLSGSVTDVAGTVIPNAQVLIKNLGKGTDVVVSANTDGLYSAPNLLPGDYQIVVSAQGFATLERAGVTLTVGAQQVLNFTLQVGQVNERIQVTSEAPSVELASSTISDNVSETTMRELPLNGRDWSQLATLRTGNRIRPNSRNSSEQRHGTRLGNDIDDLGQPAEPKQLPARWNQRE